MTPAEITALGSAVSLVLGTLFTGILHVIQLRSTDRKIQQAKQDAQQSSGASPQ